MDPALWLLPFIGAFIGWATNVIAIRMLFRPHRPVRVPMTPFSFQGVLPRRHAELAASIGRAVAEELITPAVLLERLDMGAIKGDMVAAVGRHVQNRLEAGVPKWVPQGVRDGLASYVRDVVTKEADQVIDSLMGEFQQRLARRVDVEALVTEKLMELNLEELEALAVRLAGRELHAVMLFGGVLGFFIGVLQMLIVVFLGGSA